jgi:hypothetical protein
VHYEHDGFAYDDDDGNIDDHSDHGYHDDDDSNDYGFV